MTTRCVAGRLADLFDAGEAEPLVADALTVHERSAEHDAISVLWQTDLAEAHWRHGDLLVLELDHDGAQAAFEQHLAIMRAPAMQNPSKTDLLLSLAAAHNRVGSVLERQGALREAEAAFRHGLTVDERMVARDPTNVEWARELAIAQHPLGSVLQERGERHEARRSRAAAAVAMSAIVVEHPGTALGKADLEAPAGLAPWWRRLGLRSRSGSRDPPTPRPEGRLHPVDRHRDGAGRASPLPTRPPPLPSGAPRTTGAARVSPPGGSRGGHVPRRGRPRGAT